MNLTIFVFCSKCISSQQAWCLTQTGFMLECRAAMKACAPSASAPAAAQQPSRLGVPPTLAQSPCLQPSNPGHASNQAAAVSLSAMHNDADQCAHDSNSAGLQAAHSSHLYADDSNQAQAQRSNKLMLHSGQGVGTETAHQMHSCTGDQATHGDLWTQEGGIVEYPPAYRQLVSLHF